ncbi:MAG: short-chain dehydrogenase/reductase [Bryobacterales bacterium]|nr:short-chain dehydrogenase/reductase [Bryobacterales bacterium]
MEPFLTGKNAVVTGGTRGIGRAIAESLLRAGAAVAICGRTRESVDRAVAELKQATGGEVLGEPADVSKWDQVEVFFETVRSRFGSLDILVNNAGVGVFRGIQELTLEDWRNTIDLNLTGVFHCCHHALPLLRKRGSGYIIQISSLAGINAFAGGAAYCASKFGLNGFSESIMQDLRYENIRVSYIMPGSVDTGFSPRSSRADWKIAPEDVAEVVLSLLRMPERTLVSRVEMRPSKPKKNG